jgi:hypothetical protein
MVSARLLLSWSLLNSLYDYPISGKTELPLCAEHGRQPELKELVLYDKLATELVPPDHCWVCKE